MDHSYPFWIGISYLKLNKLDSADYYVGLSVNNALLKGKEAVHYVDWFYWGLTKFKQKKDFFSKKNGKPDSLTMVLRRMMASPTLFILVVMDNGLLTVKR